MREVAVPLLCFGPPRLRAWLHEHWDELTDTSRTALSQLVSGPASPSGQDNGALRNIVATLDYEHILSALSDHDFGGFVEDVLENPGHPEVEKQYPCLPVLVEAPAPAARHVWNPLIVRRLQTKRTLPCVVLTFEEVKLLPQQEEMEPE